MQIFTLNDILHAGWIAFATTSELKGVFAEEILRQVFLPFHELSFTSVFIASVWVYILWQNKGLIFSGLSHTFHFAELAMGLFRRAYVYSADLRTTYFNL